MTIYQGKSSRHSSVSNSRFHHVVVGQDDVGTTFRNLLRFPGSGSLVTGFRASHWIKKRVYEFVLNSIGMRICMATEEDLVFCEPCSEYQACVEHKSKEQKILIQSIQAVVFTDRLPAKPKAQVNQEHFFFLEEEILFCSVIAHWAM